MPRQPVKQGCGVLTVPEIYVHSHVLRHAGNPNLHRSRDDDTADKRPGVAWFAGDGRERGVDVPESIMGDVAAMGDNPAVSPAPYRAHRADVVYALVQVLSQPVGVGVPNAEENGRSLLSDIHPGELGVGSLAGENDDEDMVLGRPLILGERDLLLAEVFVIGKVEDLAMAAAVLDAAAAAIENAGVGTHNAAERPLAPRQRDDA